MTDLRTHSGRRVEVLDGDAAKIIERGEAIEALGAQMEGASRVLRDIGDGAEEQRGRSIERIQQEVGDVHEELHLAAERYTPTGRVMKTYGQALDSVQVEMTRIVSDAEAARAVLVQRQAQAAAAASALDRFEPDADDPSATATADRLADGASAAAGLADAAREDLDDALRAYDIQFDMWDDAYEAALDGIEDATKGNVTDHWTDNLAGVVEVILTVLQVAGVILALAALIIGGPLFAALAAIAGVLALLGTLYLAAKGRRNGGDVAWAVVGVLPFGKLGKLFQSGKRMTGLREFATAPVMDIVTPVRRIVALRRLPSAEVIRQGGGMGSRAAQGLAQRIRTDFTLFSGGGPSGIVTRITQGSSRTWQNGMADAFASLTPHHQRLVSPHLGALQSVVARSEVTMPEMAINVVEFGIKRTNMVLGRSSDIMTAMNERPVDAWSAELSR